MNKKILKYVKILIVVVIIALFLWFIVIKPSYNFHKYEKELEAAAKRYYDLNYTELPTGKRISKVSMLTLYHKAFLKEDFYIPYTDEPCSLTESWVKVRKDGNGYKYYTYLKCGVLESNIDSKGPKITLNGSETMTINLGEEYKEPGIKSVVDNTDGKIDKKNVTINSKKVNVNKVGVYEIEYTATDSLKNKTTVVRNVQVVSKLKNAVKVATKDKGYYTGNNPNNYVRLSGMLFRIVDIDGDNVRVVAARDIANVNHSGITSWLDNYFMNHIAETAKKLLVENKYCNMPINEENKGTKECKSYTKKRYTYIPSVVELNKSLENKESYLRIGTMSWLANEDEKDKNKAYATRNVFFMNNQENYTMLSEVKTENYGVRPMLTIKGNTLIKSGSGTVSSPYTFGELPKAYADDNLNERYTGEYIQYAGILWRIIDINKDGTTKVISMDNIKKSGEMLKENYTDSNEVKLYNPSQTGNIGYKINNRTSEYIDTSYFVNKKIRVPIYEKEIQYGKETSTKKYEAKVYAPNMYEMFSTGNGNNLAYWLINSSKTKYYKGVVSDIGVVIGGEISDYTKFGVRVVGNLDKSVIITKGNGTEENPYTITK